MLQGSRCTNLVRSSDIRRPTPIVSLCELDPFRPRAPLPHYLMADLAKEIPGVVPAPFFPRSNLSVICQRRRNLMAAVVFASSSQLVGAARTRTIGRRLRASCCIVFSSICSMLCKHADEHPHPPLSNTLQYVRLRTEGAKGLRFMPAMQRKLRCWVDVRWHVGS